MKRKIDAQTVTSSKGHHILRMKNEDVIDLNAEYLVSTTSYMTTDEQLVFIMTDDEKFEVLECVRKEGMECNVDGADEVIEITDRSKYVFYSPPLLSKADREKLVDNYNQRMALEEAGSEESLDPVPVVKLFNPTGNGTWLLSELEPGTDIAFGLCDLGMGFPELGSVSLTELREHIGLAGLRIERDRHFKGKKTLSEYTDQAYKARCIQA